MYVSYFVLLSVNIHLQLRIFFSVSVLMPMFVLSSHLGIYSLLIEVRSGYWLDNVCMRGLKLFSRMVTHTL